jgi:hypothetical protein
MWQTNSSTWNTVIISELFHVAQEEGSLASENFIYFLSGVYEWQLWPGTYTPQIAK